MTASSLYETEPVCSEGLAWPARASSQASSSAGDGLGHGGIESGASRPPYSKGLGASEDLSSPHPHGPLYRKDQGPWFLNGGVELSTTLRPEELLEACQQIEARLGRVRSRPSTGSTISPRTLDLDILLYGEQILHTPILQVPHPRMHERGFVLIPLTEIAPNAWHPVLKKTIAQLRDQLKDSHEVKRFGEREVYCD